MYDTILVPLDGSERAETVLPHVHSLAGKYNAKVSLLRVEEPALMLEYDEVADVSKIHDAFEKRTAEAKAYLEKQEKKFTDRGLNVELRLAFGPVVKTIIDFAGNVAADLVAMASHGFGGSRRMFYGSVAAGVLQRIDRPLLIVRSRRKK